MAGVVQIFFPVISVSLFLLILPIHDTAIADPEFLSSYSLGPDENAE